jgi:amidase
MADGEIMTSGLEIEGEIDIEAVVHQRVALTGPVVETSAVVSYLASAKSLDVAVGLAVRRAHKAVSAATGLDFVKTGMYLSLVADLGITQAVNPLVTAKVTIAKDDLAIDVLRCPA